jgi:predicted Zn-dependent protease
MRLGCFLAGCGLVLLAGIRMGCGQASPQDELARHFRAGQQAMQSRRFDEAVEQFKQVLRLRPEVVEARVDLGLAYHALGDYTLAASELERAATARPDLLPAHLFLGISYLKLGSPEKAIPPLDRCLVLDSSNREARRALAAAELAEGDYSKAASQFRKLAASEPDTADAWFTLGQNYLQMAKRLITPLTIESRDAPWSLRLAGDVLGERRLFNDAASAYRQALLRAPAQPGLHSALGEVLLRSGKTKESEAEFNAELSRDPLEPAALLGLAEARLLEGSAQAALEPIAQVWRSTPELLVQAEADFPAFDLSSESAQRMAAELESAPPAPAREFLLSALFRVSGDAERSHAAGLRLEKSVEAEASRPAPGLPSRASCERHQERRCAEFLGAQKQLQPEDRVRLGRALLILGREEAAADQFAAALGKRKTNPEAAYWLSRTYLRLADACFNELAASYPDSWRAHELKGDAFHLRQAEKDAVREYRAAERLNPDAPKIHEALAEVLLDEGATEEARPELEKALQLDSGAARSLYLMGRLDVAERQPARAIPYLEAALRYDPTLVEARPVLGKAYLKVGKPGLAAAELERSTGIDRYGDLHYLLYQAYRGEGKAELAARALARSQELRRKSAADDQAKLRPADEE